MNNEKTKATKGLFAFELALYTTCIVILMISMIWMKKQTSDFYFAFASLYFVMNVIHLLVYKNKEFKKERVEFLIGAIAIILGGYFLITYMPNVFIKIIVVCSAILLHIWFFYITYNEYKSLNK